jgi:hypothetical protein
LLIGECVDLSFDWALSENPTVVPF